MVTEPNEEYVEKEVARRIGRQTQVLHDRINELTESLDAAKNSLARQNKIITQLTGEPCTFATVLETQDFVNPSVFKKNDEVVVIDRDSPHFNKSGLIVAVQGQVVDDEGFVTVKLSDGVESRFAIGMEGKPEAQVRLTIKDDGTSALISYDGKPWEVKGLPDKNLKSGTTVKIRGDNKQILGKSKDLLTGPICRITSLSPCIEVENRGEMRVVQNPKNFALEVGDRVLLDVGLSLIMDKLPAEDWQRYRLTEDMNVSWDDIGGLEFAKKQLQEAIELPYTHADLFKYYGIAPCAGVLLMGPQGCGKTYLSRACASALARIHGSDAISSGYIYVKGPELLQKWIGSTEADIRALFDRARQHYRKHGYKAILAIDEADAILPQRGTRANTSISDTVVPMFLAEMDGIDTVRTKENPIVLLMTNRADMLDPAVTRPGRISKHIKVDRPDQMAAIDILEKHSKHLPFAENANPTRILTVVAADIFSKSRILYKINNEHDFTFGDAVNGALLAEIVDRAKWNAFHRNLTSEGEKGVTLPDFRDAVQQIALAQSGLNHSYDLMDFADKIGIQARDMKIDRCFGVA